MLGLKLNHVSKRGPRIRDRISNYIHVQQLPWAPRRSLKASMDVGPIYIITTMSHERDAGPIYIITTMSHERNGVSNHQQFYCVSNSSLRLATIKQHESHKLLPYCDGNPQSSSGFPSTGVSNAESVSMPMTSSIRDGLIHEFISIGKYPYN